MWRGYVVNLTGTENKKYVKFVSFFLKADKISNHIQSVSLFNVWRKVKPELSSLEDFSWPLYEPCRSIHVLLLVFVQWEQMMSEVNTNFVRQIGYYIIDFDFSWFSNTNLNFNLFFHMKFSVFVKKCFQDKNSKSAASK